MQNQWTAQQWRTVDIPIKTIKNYTSPFEDVDVFGVFKGALRVKKSNYLHSGMEIIHGYFDLHRYRLVHGHTVLKVQM